MIIKYITGKYKFEFNDGTSQVISLNKTEARILFKLMRRLGIKSLQLLEDN